MVFLRRRLHLIFAACAVAAGVFCVSLQPDQPFGGIGSPIASAAAGMSVQSATAQSALGGLAVLAVKGQAAHASSISHSPAGLPQVMWFSGSREGARDVSIVRSTFAQSAWREPEVVATRRQLEASSARHVRKLGNPVQHVDARGIEHWFIVSVSLGGWAGARVEHWAAPSKGQTPVFRSTIHASPFLNISTLVRAQAQNLASGGFILPVYHEFLRKSPELLVFDDSGRFTHRRRPISANGLLQPVALPALGGDSGSWTMWYRDENGESGRLMNTRINAAGQTQHRPSNLANKDTGIAAIKLPDGRTLLAYNPDRRDMLRLATSVDDLAFVDAGLVASAHSKAHVPTDGSRIEYSYPSLAMIDGQVWLSYTANRTAIAVQAIDWRKLP